jgi:hypothetical protein
MPRKLCLNSGSKKDGGKHGPRTAIYVVQFVPLCKDCTSDALLALLPDRPAVSVGPCLENA